MRNNELILEWPYVVFICECHALMRYLRHIPQIRGVAMGLSSVQLRGGKLKIERMILSLRLLVAAHISLISGQQGMRLSSSSLSESESVPGPHILSIACIV